MRTATRAGSAGNAYASPPKRLRRPCPKCKAGIGWRCIDLRSSIGERMDRLHAERI